MSDWVKDGDGASDCFAVAKRILVDKIARGIVQAETATDKLVILQLSKLESGDTKEVEKLATAARMEELKREVDQMEPTKLHLKLVDGVKWVRRLAGEDSISPVTLHILSDFRQRDWGKEEGAQLNQELADFARHRKAKIQLVDTADPDRKEQGGGVAAIRATISPSSIGGPPPAPVGKDMPVDFTITLANFQRSRYAGLCFHLRRTDRNSHRPIFACRCRSSCRRARPGADDHRKAAFLAQRSMQGRASRVLSVDLGTPGKAPSLRAKLEGDGLTQDNVAYTAGGSAQDQVPVLVIDGEGKLSRQEDRQPTRIRSI